MNKQEAIDYLRTKVGTDEPVFVLRAQDLTAAGAVEKWAETVEWRYGHSEKTESAMLVARQMRAWGRDNAMKVPD